MREIFLQKHRPGLFRSGAWLDAWLATWGDSPELQLLSGLNENASDTIIFAYVRKLKNIFSVTTAFPAGISTVVAPSIRSEYFVCPQNNIPIEQSMAAYVQAALNYSWDQFYIPDVLDASPDAAAIHSAAKKHGLTCLIQDVDTAYAIDLRGISFDEYLAKLGSNTRLKLFNRRKNLSRLGRVEVLNIWPDQERFYSLLNEFHKKRWGNACYQGRNLQFMVRLLNNLAAEGHSIDLSVMTVNQEVVSVVLDILINGRVYNLQTGYVENYSKNISLGTLHFGFQIEAAFANPLGVDIYDFMAGTGKNSNYKSSLANVSSQFNSFMLVRNPLLKLLYKVRNGLG